MRRAFLIAIVISAAAVGVAGAQVTSEFIFAPGSTSFPSSHASTIVSLKGGELLSAWFGGTAEGKPDVAIWAARRTGNAWTAPSELVHEPDIPCWNPVLFHTRDGVLWLYYKFGPSPQTWTAGRMFSTDEGKTWSKPEHLPAGLLGPIRAKPFVLPNGTIVSGSSVESYGSWAVWIDRSSDGGKTWAKIGPIAAPSLPAQGTSIAESRGRHEEQGIIQPSITSLGGEHLRLYARSTGNIGRICVSDSYDRGLSWTPARALDLPNPNSGIDALRLMDGRVVLIFNNTTHGRSPLDLAVSKDGEHFEIFKTLEGEPGEFSYPAIVQAANGDLEITYTWNRKAIRYVHLPLASIETSGAKL